ncbi:hypothetical protein C0J52_23179 [Blattella germanica]|nr:hypothetical protein C0J52_23179 [Blattella germanica]
MIIFQVAMAPIAMTTNMNTNTNMMISKMTTQLHQVDRLGLMVNPPEGKVHHEEVAMEGEVLQGEAHREVIQDASLF